MIPIVAAFAISANLAHETFQKHGVFLFFLAPLLPLNSVGLGSFGLGPLEGSGQASLPVMRTGRWDGHGVK
jgi:hypothetical protein